MLILLRKHSFSMKYFLLALLSLASLRPAYAQTDERAAIEATILQLFDGMRAADSAKVAAVFHPDFRLQSVGYDTSGQAYFQTGDKDRFLQSIGSYPAGTLDEQLFGITIEVDPPLATAWTPYSFFVNGKLSHCGTNAFQLVKLDGRWLMHQVTDTRRKEGCQTEKRASADRLHTLIDGWHRAAATADADAFYGRMTADAIYLGTDATERWLRDELREWATFAFERESAWDFKPGNRVVYLSADEDYAWWEEDLDTWMGPCRGSGVAQWVAGEWKIKHYHLSVTLPNEKVDGFLELIKE
jgi:ketosteroid isomerase-like protein